LILTVTNGLTDSVPGTTGTTMSLLILCSDRWFNPHPQPFTGDLFGTQIKTVTTGFNQTLHVWAGDDRGPVREGFSNNVVIAA